MKQLKLTDAAGDFTTAENEYAAILAEGYGKLGKTYSAQKGVQERITALEAAASTPRIQKKYSLI